MKLEEKIITLRKKKQWSQEELAYHLDVSRQAVSKWESGASVPEIDKIIKLSELLEVSTDYLLIEEIVDDEVLKNEDGMQTKFLSKEEVNNYLSAARNAHIKITMGIFFAIISPALLILLIGLSKLDNSISETMSITIGLSALFILVSIATSFFIYSGVELRKYQYVNDHKLIIGMDLKKELKLKLESFQKMRYLRIVISVVLYIVSVLPLIIMGVMEANETYIITMVSLLLLIAAISTTNLVSSELKHGSYIKILEEGDYTVKAKRNSKKMEKIDSIYWLVITAIYLTISFLTARWDLTWLLYVIAGIIYAIIYIIVADKE